MTTTKTKKPLFVVTYIIALVCLLAGLLLPFYDDTMLVTQLVTAFKEILGQDVNFSGTLNVSFFGLFTLDIGALAVLLYALITVVGILLLIPVFLGKKGKAATVCPLVVEIVAAVVLFIAIFNSIGSSAIHPGTFYPRLSLVIAAGGTILMLIIQAISKYKSSGVIKLLMLVIGILGALVLVNLSVLSFYNASYGSLSGLFVKANGVSYSGYDIISAFIQYTFCKDADISYASIFQHITVTDFIDGCLPFYFASVAVLLAIINCVIDIISLGCKTTKGGLIFDCVRYGLEFIAAIVTIILALVNSTTAAGLLLIILAVIALIATVISLLRVLFYSPAKKTVESAAPVSEDYIEETYVPEPAPEPAPAPTYTYVPVHPAPAPEPAPVVETQVIYKVKEIYGGPTDSFISRLAESEKIEFCKMFIEKINGPYENIPDYVVGGDNKDFFAALFVYLGKFRPLISDGLMNKIYSEHNLLN